MRSAVPILLVGDCPSQQSGLARIIRDLATLLAADPQWRVATLGWMGSGSHRFPFTTYHMYPGEMGEASLAPVWDEWSQGEQGIIMTIWDATRLLWLAKPQYAPDSIRQWLEQRRSSFKLWGYFPLDSCGPGGKLTGMVRDVMLGYDRILVTSPWSQQVVTDTIGQEAAAVRGLDWMPHGMGGTFGVRNPLDSSAGGVSDNSVSRIGCVMTNQARKDWGLAAAIASRLPEIAFWWHCDVPNRHWNLEALIEDFSLKNVEMTGPPVDDVWMAEQYRRCALTILPSGGEGFGYPLFESLACGTPVIHGDYASGASLMRSFGLGNYLVAPVEYRIEGVHDCVRPVYSVNDWVLRIQNFLDHVDPVSHTVEHLNWMKLGHRWKRWFSDGVA